MQLTLDFEVQLLRSINQENHKALVIVLVKEVIAIFRVESERKWTLFATECKENIIIKATQTTLITVEPCLPKGPRIVRINKMFV